jgi:hypothetical protein
MGLWKRPPGGYFRGRRKPLSMTRPSDRSWLGCCVLAVVACGAFVAAAIRLVDACTAATR